MVFAEWSGLEMGIAVLLAAMFIGLSFWKIQKNSNEDIVPLGRIRKKIPDWLREVARFHRQFSIKEPLWMIRTDEYKCLWGKEQIALTMSIQHQKLLINIRSEGPLQLFFADGDLIGLKFGQVDVKNDAAKKYRKAAWEILQDVRERVGLPRQKRGSVAEAFVNTSPAGLRRHT